MSETNRNAVADMSSMGGCEYDMDMNAVVDM